MENTNSPSTTPEQWEREKAFFDAAANTQGLFDIDVVERRYQAAMERPLYPLEVAYSLMGNIRGKRVLDVGCGDGENSLLFARWGADVTGVDISPGAIRVCQQRAIQHGLTARTTFIETPFELLPAKGEQFDIIWSAAFLHHVLDRLEDVVKIFASLLAPKGCVMFLEPVRLSQTIKRIRACVPPFAVGTPDERPLERIDLARITPTFAISDKRLFGPMSRIADKFGSAQSYETATKSQKLVADSLYRLDRAVMRRSPSEFAAMIMVARLTELPRK